jgi:hypothetical protein
LNAACAGFGNVATLDCSSRIFGTALADCSDVRASICVVAFLALSSAACESALSASVEGRACGPQGECLGGYRCDPVTYVCVSVTNESPRATTDAGAAGGTGSGSGESDAGINSSVEDCREGETICGGKCVTLASDIYNCGACGLVCTAPTNGRAVCVEGDCGSVCAQGSTACGMDCVDTLSNAAHCGGCGITCPDGTLCSEGRCVQMCVPGSTACGQDCVVLASDVNNCGACGVKCAAPNRGSASCNAGQCIAQCDEGLTLCNGVCVDLKTDDANCGGCGTQCSTSGKEPESCESGTCTKPCTGLDCVCVLTTRCGKECVDTNSDRKNCGACGKECSGKEHCAFGKCQK